MFTTYSKIYSETEQLFYDVDPHDVDAWLNYPNAFLVFVIGHHKEALILPKQAVQQLLREVVQKRSGAATMCLSQ